MVSDCGLGCKESRKTYFLEVEREHNGVRLWIRMQREQDDVSTGGGEGVGWCQIVDPDVNRAGQHTVPQKTVQVFWRFSLFYTYLKTWNGIEYVSRLVTKPLIVAF